MCINLAQKTTALLHKSNFILLPLWEKVPEGRMRGVFQPKTLLTRRFAPTSPTRGEVKSGVCNNAIASSG
jgi:hypothetical protein